MGVQEDDHATAVSTPGVLLSDDETRRMTQIIAMISALPVFEIRPVPSAADRDRDYYLIAVARSARAPARGAGERRPAPTRSAMDRRSGICPSRKWLPRTGTGRSEATVRPTASTRYRDALTRLDTTDYPWIVVALMPELPGELVIDSAGFSAVQAQLWVDLHCSSRAVATCMQASAGVATCLAADKIRPPKVRRRRPAHRRRRLVRRSTR